MDAIDLTVILVALVDRLMPLFVTEHALYSSLGMTGEQPEDSGVDTLSVTDLTIVDATHPLAAGLSGTVTVLQPGKGQYGFGVPGPGAVVVANLVDETRGAAIFAYDEGSATRFARAIARCL